MQLKYREECQGKWDIGIGLAGWLAGHSEMKNEIVFVGYSWVVYDWGWPWLLLFRSFVQSVSG